jgi:predicted RNase H-like HicB family nuclease
MKTISFVVWKEKNEFVSQCLNVDVSSHGNTLDEAIKNLKEAVELYFEDERDSVMPEVESMYIEKETIYEKNY